MAAKPLALEDLEHILRETGSVWEQLRHQRIFITGGTGFFGCWLLESFCIANRSHDLRAKATVLTRDPAAFIAKAPHLAEDPSITLLAGDVRSFQYPEGEFRFILHAATEASVLQAQNQPLEMLSTIVDGTRHLLEFAEKSRAQKLLLTSSGAVYGVQPPEMTHMAEGFMGGPDPLDPVSVYGEGKRFAEQMCIQYAARSGVECKVARCFAFVGPHLPLDGHFAIGNFIRNVMEGKPILIQGDWRPMRSYLYAADLAVWLWTMLFEAAPARAYNVGSEIDVSILDLAKETAMALGRPHNVQVVVQPTDGPPIRRYVPDTKRAQRELGLRQHIGLAEAIRRTAKWHGFELGRFSYTNTSSKPRW